jgi:hypothetical protein
MLAGLVILGIVLFYVNNRAPVVTTPPAQDVLDTLDTSRYRTEAAVDTTIDY